MDTQVRAGFGGDRTARNFWWLHVISVGWWSDDAVQNRCVLLDGSSIIQTIGIWAHLTSICKRSVINPEPVDHHLRAFSKL